MDYEATKKDGGKALRLLQRAVLKTEVREAVRGLYPLSSEEVLLEAVRELQGRIDPNRVYLTGEEAQEEQVRVLSEYSDVGRSPQRREYQKQLARKLTDIVPKLPYEIALEIVATGDILWLAYTSIYSQKVSIKGRLVENRNPRLKGLGNAIVPQVAEEIMRAML